MGHRRGKKRPNRLSSAKAARSTSGEISKPNHRGWKPPPFPLPWIFWPAVASGLLRLYADRLQGERQEERQETAACINYRGGETAENSELWLSRRKAGLGDRSGDMATEAVQLRAASVGHPKGLGCTAGSDVTDRHSHHPVP
jgi:hypothetical protein